MSQKEAATISWRPTLVGRHYAVSSGHYLATAAAMRVLDAGGNAVDAGVTAAMALAVLQPDVVSFAGVAPTLLYLHEEGRIISLAGLGYWPQATDVARLIAEGGPCVPEGILRQVVPAAPATHIEALRHFGTLSFEQAVTPAFELARDGYACYPVLHDVIALHAPEIARYPENAAIFLPGGQPPAVGSLFRQTNLAKTLWRLIEAERQARGDRDAKLHAVHACFYRGAIAAEIAAFHAQYDGFMTAADLANFTVPIESSISCQYGDYTVHACDTWCQGIVLLESLKILEGIDLRALGHNTPAYLHTLAEALNLAFADREAYVGDPRFVDVPTGTLLSAAYAAAQRARISPERTAGCMPAPGVIAGRPCPLPQGLHPAQGAVPAAPDTIHVCVVDAQGNSYAATPSDTMYDTPMVPGLGLLISSRGMQGRLQPGHPCAVVPGKRPRLTPTPGLAFQDGQFFMAWGTPGGDIQCQAMLQVFLNVVAFGMSMQLAIEAPRIGTFSFPNSFAPHSYLPGRLCLEQRIAEATITDLARRGYDIEQWSAASWHAGAICAITRDRHTGLLHAGADMRREAYAAVW